MKTQSTRIERRIRLAGILLIAGLLVELVTLRWSHPTAFLLFLLLGGAFMALGIAIYLFSLVSAENKLSDICPVPSHFLRLIARFPFTSSAVAAITS
jgi:hypothetical protein